MTDGGDQDRIMESIWRCNLCGVETTNYVKADNHDCGGGETSPSSDDRRELTDGKDAKTVPHDLREAISHLEYDSPGAALEFLESLKDSFQEGIYIRAKGETSPTGQLDRMEDSDESSQGKEYRCYFCSRRFNTTELEKIAPQSSESYELEDLSPEFQKYIKQDDEELGRNGVWMVWKCIHCAENSEEERAIRRY